MVTIKESLTFDDVLLLPRYSEVLPSETDISVNLSRRANDESIIAGLCCKRSEGVGSA